MVQNVVQERKHLTDIHELYTVATARIQALQYELRLERPQSTSTVIVTIRPLLCLPTLPEGVEKVPI